MPMMREQYFPERVMLKRCLRPLLVIVFCALSAAPVKEKEWEHEAPPPLKHYKGREIAQTMHYTGAAWLTRESRQREEDCALMLTALNIQPGQTLCDLGCGNGFYTLQLAKLTGPDGKVLAVDIQKEMLDLLR